MNVYGILYFRDSVFVLLFLHNLSIVTNCHYFLGGHSTLKTDLKQKNSMKICPDIENAKLSFFANVYKKRGAELRLCEILGMQIIAVMVLFQEFLS